MEGQFHSPPYQAANTQAADPLQSYMLAGRYKLERRIARTDQSVVYRAFDQQTYFPVVVKMARSHLVLPGQPIDMNYYLREEANTLRYLTRYALPVPQLLELVSYHDRICLVMTYVPGATLELVCRYGWISTRRIAQVIVSVARIIQRAHWLGYVHHDIKPSNIILHPECNPVLIDWGSARQIDTTMARLPISFTPEFARLEQMQGMVAVENDVYALGRLLQVLIPAPHSLLSELIERACSAGNRSYGSAMAFGTALSGLLLLDRLATFAGSRGVFS